MKDNGKNVLVIVYFLFAMTVLHPAHLPAQTSFGPEEIVQVGSVDISVPGFSVPSFVDWNGDDLPDLIVGEGGLGSYDGKVRVYINTGAPGSPAFSSFFYVQSEGSNLVSPSGG
jgi:hypothetical protein